MTTIKILRIITIALIAALATACGQKGPLRLPDAPKATVVSGQR